MSEVSTEIINFTYFIVLPFYINICTMLNAYFVLTFYYAIYCTVQHHIILLYTYGVVDINKHFHYDSIHFWSYSIVCSCEVVSRINRAAS